MAAWIIPALKAVLPHVSTIVAAAKPMFTNSKTEEASVLPHFLQQQITELQTATVQNDAHIKELAEQLKSMVAALQESAAIAESKSRRLVLISGIALFISLATALATGVVLFSK